MIGKTALGEKSIKYSNFRIYDVCRTLTKGENIFNPIFDLL